MDHFRQAIYIEAMRLIENGDCSYCCDALGVAAENVLGIDGDTAAKYIVKLTPEFFRLDDSSFWARTGEQVPDYDVGGWWEHGWIEPRIRALDVALRRCA